MSEENATKNPAPPEATPQSDGGPLDPLAELRKQLEERTREASENYDRYVRGCSATRRTRSSTRTSR
jgi:hypothetical protein